MLPDEVAEQHCRTIPCHASPRTGYIAVAGPMEAKNFAVGFRVEHPQKMINDTLYGKQKLDMPAAPYKVTSNFPNGRGVYSFCMCPGGYVVNSSSEEEMLVVNGMSYSGRDSSTANSAIIISVDENDFMNPFFFQNGSEYLLQDKDALSGMRFQQALERKAYHNGFTPIRSFLSLSSNVAKPEM